MSVGGLWVGVRYLVEGWLGKNMDWVPYITTADVIVIAPFLIAIAFALAAISSLVTLSRHTKV